MSKESIYKRSSLLKSYPKNIFCLESLWNDDVENKLSVLPILEIASKANQIKYIHLYSNTRSEFEYNLGFLHRKRTYQILYLAFHGSSDNISLADAEISLSELASILNGRFPDLTVHFGTCGTIDVKNSDLSQFTKNAGIRMLSGYSEDVGWIESAAMELLFFSALQSYKNTRYLEAYLTKTYPDLIRATGFKMLTP